MQNVCRSENDVHNQLTYRNLAVIWQGTFPQIQRLTFLNSLFVLERRTCFTTAFLHQKNTDLINRWCACNLINIQWKSMGFWLCTPNEHVNKLSTNIVSVVSFFPQVMDHQSNPSNTPGHTNGPGKKSRSENSDRFRFPILTTRNFPLGYSTVSYSVLTSC